MRTNRKGDLPITLLVFMVIFLVGFSLYKFSTFGGEQNSLIGDVGFLESVYFKEKSVQDDLYYSARQGIVESYYQIASEGGIFGEKNPEKSNGKAIFGEFNSEGLEALFSEKMKGKINLVKDGVEIDLNMKIFNEKFNFTAGEMYFSEALAVKNKKRYLISNFIPTTVKDVELAVNIGVVYRTKIKVNLNLDTLGLESFFKIFNETRKCQNDKDLKFCLSIGLKNFNVEVSEMEEFKEIKLSSKRAFLIGGEIRKAEFSFLVKKT